MALVCEFQKMYDKVYKKTCKWLHYINFKNLRKNLQMASLCKFQKSTKKPANGFSMWISKMYDSNWPQLLTCHIFLSFEILVRKDKIFYPIKWWKLHCKIYEKTGKWLQYVKCPTLCVVEGRGGGAGAMR